MARGDEQMQPHGRRVRSGGAALMLLGTTAVAAVLVIAWSTSSLRTARERREWLGRNGAAAGATITLVRMRGGELCGLVDVQFQALDGTVRQVTALEVLPSEPTRREGDVLPIRYDPQDPEFLAPADDHCGDRYGEWRYWAAGTTASGMLLATICVAVWWSVRSRRGTRSSADG